MVNPLFTCFGSANEGLPLNPRVAFYFETNPDDYGYVPNLYGFGYRDLGLGTFRPCCISPRSLGYRSQVASPSKSFTEKLPLLVPERSAHECKK
jgi:hypothetical protein